MNLYADWIFPTINNLVTRPFAKYRRKLLSSLPDTPVRILEIGFGAGLSLPFFPPQVSEICAVEPSEGMRRRAQRRLRRSPHRVNLTSGGAESLPFGDASFDGAVSFLTLCSVGDLEKSVQEVHRALKPEGKLYFLEHGIQSEGRLTRRLQQGIQPLWGKLACGCHLTRDPIEALQSAGFKIEELQIIGHNGFPNVASPMYLGIARKASTEDTPSS